MGWDECIQLQMTNRLTEWAKTQRRSLAENPLAVGDSLRPTDILRASGQQSYGERVIHSLGASRVPIALIEFGKKKQKPFSYESMIENSSLPMQF